MVLAAAALALRWPFSDRLSFFYAAQLPNRKMKVALGVGSVLFGGLGVCVFAITYQQSKTKGA